MGIIKAAFTAAGSMMEDQWKEFFYCDALPNDQIMVRGIKRTNPNSANNGTPDNVISIGSKIVVNEGQAAIVVDTGRVIACYQEAGSYTFEPMGGRKGLWQEFSERVAFGGDNVATQHRLYYINLHDSLNHPFVVCVPVRVQASGSFLTTTYRLEGHYCYHLSDPTSFYRHVTGNADRGFVHGNISHTVNSELEEALTEVAARLAQHGLKITDLPAHTKQLCAAVREKMQNSWCGRNGIEISEITLSSVTGNLTNVQQREDTAWISGSGTPTRSLAEPMSNEQKKSADEPDISEQIPKTISEAKIHWRCQCGTQNESRFCTECGAQRPEVWTCRCGEQGTGKFCINCGSPRPNKEERSNV